MTFSLDRRQLLGVSGAVTAGVLAGYSTAKATDRPAFSAYPFSLGVASGEPLPDGVVLWTRLAPEPLAADGRGGMADSVVSVRWEVAHDEQFQRIATRGQVDATPELGHSVHVDVRRLAPGRHYFYRFVAGGEVSPVGRTKTAPTPTAAPSSLRLALASCQAWAGGRYAAYRAMAADDLDLVLHVGDYIYENADTETLADFRNQHALYKSSPDLQAAHAAHPFVVTFDDHDVENNWAGDVSQPDGEASNAYFLRVRAAAFQAYYEHMPLRRAAKPLGPDMHVYRRLRFGDLVSLNVLDTRQYRDDQLNEGFPSAPLDSRSSDPGRDFLGPEQEQWLVDGMTHSATRWNVLAQQTIMAHYDYDAGEGIAVNHDQWDGYIGARDRLLDFVASRRPANPVVLTGDWHSSWVNDVTADYTDPASEILMSEFVGTSISSGCGWEAAVSAALSVNPQVKFFDGVLHGYVRCSVTPSLWRSDYQVVTSAGDTENPATTLTSWVVEDGQPGALPA